MRYKHIAKHVKSLRKRNGLTQQKIATTIGMRVQQFSAIERGTQTLPTRYIVDFCKLVNTSYRGVINAKTADYANDLTEAVDNYEITRADYIAEQKQMKHENRVEGMITIPHLGEVR